MVLSIRRSLNFGQPEIRIYFALSTLFSFFVEYCPIKHKGTSHPIVTGDCDTRLVVRKLGETRISRMSDNAVGLRQLCTQPLASTPTPLKQRALDLPYLSPGLLPGLTYTLRLQSRRLTLFAVRS